MGLLRKMYNQNKLYDTNVHNNVHNNQYEIFNANKQAKHLGNSKSKSSVQGQFAMEKFRLGYGSMFAGLSSL